MDSENSILINTLRNEIALKNYKSAYDKPFYGLKELDCFARARPRVWTQKTQLLILQE